MDNSVMYGMSVPIILVGYLATQGVLAAIMYLSIRAASRRELKQMLTNAGHSFFFEGFSDAARDAFSKLLKESHDNALQAAGTALQVARELAVRVSADTASTAERIDKMDAELSEIRSIVGRIDKMSDDIHATKNIVSGLNAYVRGERHGP